MSPHSMEVRVSSLNISARSVGEGMPRAAETVSHRENQMLCVPATLWPVGTDR
jgi:hypothetical protein